MKSTRTTIKQHEFATQENPDNLKPKKQHSHFKPLVKLWNRVITFLFCNNSRVLEFFIIKDHTPKVDIKLRLVKNCKDLCTYYGDGHYYEVNKRYCYDDARIPNPNPNPDPDPDFHEKNIVIKNNMLMKKTERFDLIRHGVVGNIVNINDYLANHFDSDNEVDVRVRQQGNIINKNFYFQKTLGQGNCFYLSYLTGWLHHIVAHNTIDEAIALLKNQTAYRKDVQRRHAIDYTPLFIKILKKLKEDPSLERIGAILSDSNISNKLANYFRDFAVFGVANATELLIHHGEIKEYIRQPLGTLHSPDSKWRYVWDHDALIRFDMDEDLRDEIINKEKTLSRETYCRIQRENGADVQRPEIGILHDYFIPITLYQRMDVPELDRLGNMGDEGRVDGYGTNNTINLFRSPGHYDALIKKSLIAKTMLSQLCIDAP